MRGLDNVVKKPRYFQKQAAKRGSSYYDYENNFNLVWSPADLYLCTQKIGRGKYSEVFDAINIRNSQPCVVKVLKPIKFKKINREIKILMAVSGKHNAIQLLDIVKIHNIHCLVFEKVNTTDYRKLIATITPMDCRHYLYEILKGLHHCHSLGIMHRDIKPQNVLIDDTKKEVRIIDWGLGEFYLPQKDYNVKVSSRYYKGPELLVDYEYYHYSLDIWSCGVMMAGMIFGKEPFFKGQDNYDQLEEITKTLGTEELYEYLHKYNISLDIALERSLSKNRAVKLQSLVTPGNAHLATPDALDLLARMIQYDHDLRPSAAECMRHPYFKEIRQQNKQ